MYFPASLRKCCFEVGDDVYDEFRAKIDWSTEYCHRTGQKWHFDLPAIIKRTLLEEGVEEEKQNATRIYSFPTGEITAELVRWSEL